MLTRKLLYACNHTESIDTTSVYAARIRLHCILRLLNIARPVLWYDVDATGSFDRQLQGRNVVQPSLRGYGRHVQRDVRIGEASFRLRKCGR